MLGTYLQADHILTLSFAAAVPLSPTLLLGGLCGRLGLLAHHLQDLRARLRAVLWLAVDRDRLLRRPHVLLAVHVHARPANKILAFSNGSRISGRRGNNPFSQKVRVLFTISRDMAWDLN